MRQWKDKERKRKNASAQRLPLIDQLATHGSYEVKGMQQFIAPVALLQYLFCVTCIKNTYYYGNSKICVQLSVQFTSLHCILYALNKCMFHVDILVKQLITNTAAWNVTCKEVLTLHSQRTI